MHIRYFVLLMLFIFAQLCARAQIKPKWVNDLRGTAGNAVATYLAVDKQNNIYVTGYFQGTVDFDPSLGIKNLTSVGGTDIFIGKYTQSGTLIWVESVGGTNYDLSTGLAVDKDGNVSIVGYFNSKVLDADPGPGVYDLNGSINGATTGFIIHLNTNGGFLWANSVNGSGGSDITWQVTTDSQGNVITTSQFEGYLTIGNTTINGSGLTGLVTKYAPAGNVLWFLSFDTDQSGSFTSAYGIAADSQDNIVVSGLFTGKTNFSYPGASPYYLTDPNIGLNSTHPSAFIAKYTQSGALIWANGVNSPELIDGAYSTVAIDRQNNVYFSAFFGVSLTFGDITFNFSGDAQQACLAKYSSAGVLQFAEPIGAQQGAGFFGGISDVNYMTFDTNNNLYLSGYFRNTVNFNANTATPVNLTSNGYNPSFYIAKYDSLGICTYAIGAGGNCDSTLATNVAIDGDNNIDVAGGFCSTVNFDPSGCSPESLTAASTSDPFFAQYEYTALSNNIITAPAITNFCTNGSPTSITGSVPKGGNGTYNYQWLSSADSVTFADITGANAQSYTSPTLIATTYYERMVSSDTCTTPGVSNIIGLHILPTLAAPVVTIATTTSSSVIFIWTAVPGAKGYQVSTNGGQTYMLVNGLADTINNLQPGQSVTITVESTGSIACQINASATATGNVPASDVVFVANAFTPNGDGRNDVLHVKGENIQSLKFYIYDQWGELIFTSTNIDNGWDGTYKGTKEPVGVYVYDLQAVLNDGTSVKKKGTVTLLK